jgi:hypothetical protein
MRNCVHLLIVAIVLGTSANIYGQTIISKTDDSISSFNFGFESDFASKYIWRGLAFSRGTVNQNSASLSFGNLTGSIWSNYDFNVGSNQPRFNELDYALSYDIAVNNFSFGSMIQAYFYPHQKESRPTAEISVNMSYEAPVLQPFTIQTLDIKEFQGAYFGELGLRLSQDIGKRLSIEASSEIGWGSTKFNAVYIGGGGWSLYLISFEAGSTWNFNDALYFRPHIMLTSIIDNKIRVLVENPTLFQFGITLGVQF